MKAEATKQSDYLKKLRTANIQNIMTDVKLLIDSNKRIRYSLTPPLPSPPPAPAAADSDSDEDGAAASPSEVAPSSLPLFSRVFA